MSIESFGGCTRLPLADCPFTRSRLTLEAAEREFDRMTQEPAVIVTGLAYPLPVEDLHPLDEELLRRPGLPERVLQVLIVAAEAPEDETPAVALPDTFWLRLAWLRQGGSY